MGILGALSTAVSGLAVQSYALENISGNIANSQTVGYKRVNTSFVDFVPQAPAQHETSGSVLAYSQLTNTIQGTTQTTGVATNMALSGDGFFAVSKNTGTVAVPSFNGANFYTRRGDFKTDANGYLTNGAGYYLSGTSFNPATGAVISPATSPIQISDVDLPAVATTEIDYTGNLPTIPKPGSYAANPTGVGSAASEPFTPMATSDPDYVFTVAGTSVTLRNRPATSSTATYNYVAPVAAGGADVEVAGQTYHLAQNDAGSVLAGLINADAGSTVTAIFNTGAGTIKLTNKATGVATAAVVGTGGGDEATVFGNGTIVTPPATTTGDTLDDSGTTAAKAAAAIQTALTGAANTSVKASASGSNVVFTNTAHDTSAAPVNVTVSGTSPLGAATNTVGAYDDSYLIRPGDFDAAVNPVTGSAVQANNTTAFINETIDGGQVVVYDSTGTPSSVQVRWAKVTNATSSDPAQWKMFYENDSSATGTKIQWKLAGTATFNLSGNMVSPAAPASFSIPGLTINGTLIGDVTLDLSKGLTQYNDPNGTAISTLTQNGSAIGTLSSVAVSSDGIVTGTYSNGKTGKLASVTVAHFNAPDALKREDGGAYSETVASGGPTYGLGSTTLSGGAVEESNTDISDEFSKMIVTQQAYSANTKVMTTAQSMLQDVINIVR